MEGLQPGTSHAVAGAFFEEIARGGVAHVCVSPGSRSTPLAVAAHRTPGLRCWSHIDERSAGFFALGMAKASGRPVALVCTSGTAAANYAPAVLEAHHAEVPLLVLTADRPPELREWGAGQTVDQVKLYGASLRWFVELPVLSGTASPPAEMGRLVRYACSLAARAVDEAAGGGAPGPVHLNWPLREPLEPPVAAGAREEPLPGRRAAPYAQVAAAPRVPEPETVATLARIARACPRGLIVCGPVAPSRDMAPVGALARATGWPIFADPASQLRCGPHVDGNRDGDGAPVLAHGDLLLRAEGFAGTWTAQCVVRIGQSPVSKALRLWLDAHPPEHLVLVDPGHGWHDPGHLASHVVRADPARLCRAWADALADAGLREGAATWTEAFLAADRRAAGAVEATLAAEARLFEPRAVRELCDALPEDTALYVANSMPIRHLDAVLPSGPRPLRVLANRGANGIDGTASSALGAAAVADGRVVLLTGDLALLHDLGGLLAARRHGLDLVIVVLNNDGGGIFHHLPIAEQGDAVGFEPLFATPHGLDLGRVAALFDLAYTRVVHWEHYRAALKEAFASPGVHLIEVPVERVANAEHFRALVAAAVRAVETVE